MLTLLSSNTTLLRTEFAFSLDRYGILYLLDVKGLIVLGGRICSTSQNLGLHLHCALLLSIRIVYNWFLPGTFTQAGVP